MAHINPIPAPIQRSFSGRETQEPVLIRIRRAGDTDDVNHDPTRQKLTILYLKKADPRQFIAQDTAQQLADFLNDPSKIEEIQSFSAKNWIALLLSETVNLLGTSFFNNLSDSQVCDLIECGWINGLPSGVLQKAMPRLTASFLGGLSLNLVQSLSADFLRQIPSSTLREICKTKELRQFLEYLTWQQIEAFIPEQANEILNSVSSIPMSEPQVGVAYTLHTEEPLFQITGVLLATRTKDQIQNLSESFFRHLGWRAAQIAGARMWDWLDETRRSYMESDTRNTLEDNANSRVRAESLTEQEIRTGPPLDGSILAQLSRPQISRLDLVGLCLSGPFLDKLDRLPKILRRFILESFTPSQVAALFGNIAARDAFLRVVPLGELPPHILVFVPAEFIRTTLTPPRMFGVRGGHFPFPVDGRNRGGLPQSSLGTKYIPLERGQIDALSEGQQAAFSAVALMGLDSVAIRAIKLGAIALFDSDQVAATAPAYTKEQLQQVSEAALRGFSCDQARRFIDSLDDERRLCLSPGQIAALFRWLTFDDLPRFIPGMERVGSTLQPRTPDAESRFRAVTRLLTPQDLPVSSNRRDLSDPALSQLRFLRLTDFQRDFAYDLSGITFRELPPQHFARRSPRFTRDLPPDLVRCITPRQLPQLPSETFVAFPSSHIPLINPTAFAAVTAGHLSAISESEEHVRAIRIEQLQVIPVDTLRGMSVEDLRRFYVRLSEPQRDNLTEDQRAFFEDVLLKGVAIEQAGRKDQPPKPGGSGGGTGTGGGQGGSGAGGASGGGRGLRQKFKTLVAQAKSLFSTKQAATIELVVQSISLEDIRKADPEYFEAPPFKPPYNDIDNPAPTIYDSENQRKCALALKKEQLRAIRASICPDIGPGFWKSLTPYQIMCLSEESKNAITAKIIKAEDFLMQLLGVTELEDMTPAEYANKIKQIDLRRLQEKLTPDKIRSLVNDSTSYLLYHLGLKAFFDWGKNDWSWAQMAELSEEVISLWDATIFNGISAGQLLGLKLTAIAKIPKKIIAKLGPGFFANTSETEGFQQGYRRMVWALGGNVQYISEETISQLAASSDGIRFFTETLRPDSNNATEGYRQLHRFSYLTREQREKISFSLFPASFFTDLTDLRYQYPEKLEQIVSEFTDQQIRQIIGRLLLSPITKKTILFLNALQSWQVALVTKELLDAIITAAQFQYLDGKFLQALNPELVVVRTVEDLNKWLALSKAWGPAWYRSIPLEVLAQPGVSLPLWAIRWLTSDQRKQLKQEVSSMPFEISGTRISIAKYYESFAKIDFANLPLLVQLISLSISPSLFPYMFSPAAIKDWPEALINSLTAHKDVVYGWTDEEIADLPNGKIKFININVFKDPETAKKLLRSLSLDPRRDTLPLTELQVQQLAINELPPDLFGDLCRKWGVPFLKLLSPKQLSQLDEQHLRAIPNSVYAAWMEDWYKTLSDVELESGKYGNLKAPEYRSAIRIIIKSLANKEIPLTDGQRRDILNGKFIIRINRDNAATSTPTPSLRVTNTQMPNIQIPPLPDISRAIPIRVEL